MIKVLQNWQDKIEIADDIKMYGLSWKPLLREDISEMITYAKSEGLTLIGEQRIPECHNRCVTWHDTDFTFSLQVFKKAK